MAACACMKGGEIRALMRGEIRAPGGASGGLCMHAGGRGFIVACAWPGIGSGIVY